MYINSTAYQQRNDDEERTEAGAQGAMLANALVNPEPEDLNQDDMTLQAIHGDLHRTWPRQSGESRAQLIKKAIKDFREATSMTLPTMFVGRRTAEQLRQLDKKNRHVATGGPYSGRLVDYTAQMIKAQKIYARKSGKGIPSSMLQPYPNCRCQPLDGKELKTILEQVSTDEDNIREKDDELIEQLRIGYGGRQAVVLGVDEGRVMEELNSPDDRSETSDEINFGDEEDWA